MKISAGIAGGLAGTIAVASVHEALKRVTPDAPRMDTLNVDLISKGFNIMNKQVPREDKLWRWAVGGELLFDTAYYSLTAVGGKKGVWFRGTLLGLVAGVTAVFLPKLLGLPKEPTNKTLATKVMATGLYVVGGLAAAAATQLADHAQSKNKM